MCVERWGTKELGCQHGIGHGVLWYLGEDHLLDALKVCGHLSTQGAVIGCGKGVFMEYNLDSATNATMTASLREFSSQNPYAPCDSVPNFFQSVCYFELPRWWDAVFFHDYEQISSYCGEIEKDNFRKDCFSGLDNKAAFNAQFDALKTYEICKTATNNTNISSCLIGAYDEFMGEPKFRYLAPEICAEIRRHGGICNE